MKPTNYRADIDGLRAFAVCAVLAFHAFPNLFPGGFVGVDVFFVISGFLITGILLSEARSGRINIAGFYFRRVRRIFPALIIVLSSCLLLGWAILLPTEFVQLGKHVIASAAFSINIVLWQEIGYFNNAAITKPLLHLWSLGVEEQFYIVWPLLLVCITKWSKAVLPWIVVFLAVSFAFNIVQTGTDSSGAFFLPMSRAWELLLGAGLAAGRLDRLKIPRLVLEGFSIAGAALLIASIVTVSQVGFPGWQALLPVVGTGFVIAAGPSSIVNRYVLSLPPSVYVGKISYPLYLWHWPLLSFARITTQDDISPERSLLILALSVVLASATYAFCERPIGRLKARVRLVASLVGGMVLTAGLAGIVFKMDGKGSRIAARNHFELGFDGGWPPSGRACPFTSKAESQLLTCFMDGAGEPRFALVGDSKAGALFAGLFRSSVEGGRWVFFGSGGGGPLLPVLTKDPLYGGYNKAMPQIAFQHIVEMKSVDTVVIAAAVRALFHIKREDSLEELPSSPYYQSTLSALDSYVQEYVAAGKKVVLLADNPTLPAMEDCADRMADHWWLKSVFGSGPNVNCKLSLSKHRRVSALYHKMLKEISDRHVGAVAVFYSDSVLCDEAENICPVYKNGRPLYGITDHISDYAATLVGLKLNQFLSDRLAQP